MGSTKHSEVVELSFKPSTGHLLMNGTVPWLPWSMCSSLRKKSIRLCWKSMHLPVPTTTLIWPSSSKTSFLEEQAESIHQIAKYIAQLTRVGEGVGVHIFDKELQ